VVRLDRDDLQPTPVIDDPFAVIGVQDDPLAGQTGVPPTALAAQRVIAEDCGPIVAGAGKRFLRGGDIDLWQMNAAFACHAGQGMADGGRKQGFARYGHELHAQPDIQVAEEAMLRVCSLLLAELATIEGRLVALAKADPVTRLLMTVPGVAWW
jgi:hypothetical protein